MKTSLVFCAALLVACGHSDDASTGSGGAGSSGNSSTSAASGGGGGSDATLDSASAKFPDFQTLWSASIARTCGPNNGVCHNSKQFPDMQTATGMLTVIGQRCNQLRDDPSTVDNLCEPDGDTIQIGTFKTTVGAVIPKPDAANPTSVDLTLKDAIPDGATTDAVSFIRALEGLPEVTIPVPAATITTLTPGQKVITFDYAALQAADGLWQYEALSDFVVPAKWMAGAEDQLQLGDPNGDGIFGATLGGALIKPGDPLKSYLFKRITAPLTTGPSEMDVNVTDSKVVEQQMPLANYQYWDAPNASLALWCWISTMKADGSNASGPIDYASCDTSKITAPTHQDGLAVTYSHIYEDILQPSCALACHFQGTTQATTFFIDDPKTAYPTLVGLMGKGPSESTLPFVTPDDPMSSYLYLKVSSKKPPSGSQMPPPAPLSADQVAQIQTWIAQGANQN